EDVLPDVLRPPAAGAFGVEPVEELLDVFIGVIPPLVTGILLKGTDPLAIRAHGVRVESILLHGSRHEGDRVITRILAAVSFPDDAGSHVTRAGIPRQDRAAAGWHSRRRSPTRGTGRQRIAHPRQP